MTSPKSVEEIIEIELFRTDTTEIEYIYSQL